MRLSSAIFQVPVRRPAKSFEAETTRDRGVVIAVILGSFLVFARKSGRLPAVFVVA